MTKNQHLPKSLPPLEHPFSLELEGKITRELWQGDFIVKIPNTKEKCLIAKHRAFLNGKLAEFLDAGTLGIHRKIAYLRYTLISYPEWWRDSDLGYELLDHNIIEEIYKQVMTHENRWFKSIWGSDEDAIEDQT